MRHRAKGRQLSRTSSHKKATLNNMATSLFQHGGIQTTEAKAKELRPFAERLITLARRGDLHARRLVERRIKDKAVTTKLFAEIGKRFAARPGGYTRLLRVGFRQGDSAPVAQVELVGSEFDPKAHAEAEASEDAKPKAKGVGGRLRAAAERLRGKKEEQSEAGASKKAAKPSKGAGAGRRSTTPRKAGGS